MLVLNRIRNEIREILDMFIWELPDEITSIFIKEKIEKNYLSILKDTYEEILDYKVVTEVLDKNIQVLVYIKDKTLKKFIELKFLLSH